jgi:hypothetical protein
MFTELYNVAYQVKLKFQEINLSLNSYNMSSTINARFDCCLYGFDKGVDSKGLLALLLEMHYSVNSNCTAVLTIDLNGRILKVNEMNKHLHIVEETTEKGHFIESYLIPTTDLESDWDNAEKKPVVYGGWSDIYED